MGRSTHAARFSDNVEEAKTYNVYGHGFQTQHLSFWEFQRVFGARFRQDFQYLAASPGFASNRTTRLQCLNDLNEVRTIHMSHTSTFLFQKRGAQTNTCGLWMVASALLLLWDERQIAEFYWKSYSADICGALLMPQRLKPEAHSDVLKGASLDCSHGGKPHTHTSQAAICSNQVHPYCSVNGRNPEPPFFRHWVTPAISGSILVLVVRRFRWRQELRSFD